ncbi:MAG: hypothetical protein GF317_11095 [Candidatus Lokiarchaeota archaeon]|nr:hypothetical protein [Candidatus Lokiarchaeota archaeon]
MKNLEKLLLIFERDFVNNDFDVLDGEFEIVKDGDELITANGALTIHDNKNGICMAQITEGVYEKKYLIMINDMEKYQKELS